ncbi:magnesium transporter [Fusibacter tunisiensis]|uniref:Magnesium transport protein CorA n=2 Tax=Fusibacter tunisiensis TaxID=1008308 RepID=A0ABS2MPV7_9FIRM|nr:magnesium transporter [Fusibacter tunisiensis]
MNFMNFKDPLSVFQQKKQTVGEAPGTLSYTGIHENIEVTIEVYAYDEAACEHFIVKDFSEVDLVGKNYWINITGLNDVTLIREIGEKFDLHLMDLEDVVHVSQRSKIELKESYLFSIIKMMYLRNDEIRHEHVSIFVKDNVLMTFQETEGDVFDGVRSRLEKNGGRTRARGTDYLFYSLLDAVVDHYFPVVSKSYEQFSEVEMAVLETGSTDMTDIYQLRKELLYMVNAISPIKDAITGFTREVSDYFNPQDAPYYSDVMDHLNQLTESLKSYREMITSLYEMQMAEKSNALNKTMMTLTIFSVIFIPLSFLAGVFGMNFVHFPGLSFPYAFHIFAGACVVIGAGMWGYFKFGRD